MTDAERDDRLKSWPDLKAGLIEAISLLEKHHTMFSLLREHFPPGEWEATSREIEDNIAIFKSATETGTPRKAS